LIATIKTEKRGGILDFLLFLVVEEKLMIVKSFINISNALSNVFYYLWDSLLLEVFHISLFFCMKKHNVSNYYTKEKSFVDLKLQLYWSRILLQSKISYANLLLMQNFLYYIFEYLMTLI
jgi:hypothetical protein